MPLFTWKAEYSVNNPELDKHHIRLFEILNTAYENVMKSHGDDCCFPDIEELSAYTTYHFETEEQFMEQQRFPGIEAHVAEHRQFASNIERLKADYYKGHRVEAAQELIVLLGQWLIHHVLMEDRKYSFSAEPAC